ncbi:hypothetical protein CYK55_00315 (plasmid) [Enterococcus mundtii]|uniref:hypothetical protein n=1 Tax=Enterococcus mundtii TaxID=53346 RepID=UPI000F7D04A0|nr:hypothetical protein [Enterococcus mundtii]AZP91658.1 hypothetical protein CYK55_00315 [Enterococcus mundtii]
MADIENILATHLKQVETIVKQSIEAVDALSVPTENQIKEETTKVKRTIGQILSDFKENLKQYVRTQKNNTVYQVTNTMDDIRLGLKNSFNRKLLSINGLLKQFSNTIDRKFVIEEKRNQSPLAEKTKEVQENDSKEATQKEQEKVSESSVVSENQAPAAAPETQPTINTAESVSDQNKQHSEEPIQQNNLNYQMREMLR